MSANTIENLPEYLFQVLFEKSPGSLLVKADAPRFTIIAASDAYLAITAVKREQVLGQGFFETFPDDNDDPADDTTARKIFTRVIESGEKIDVPVYRYDILDTATGKRDPHYWSNSNIPILDKDNKVAYILNTIVDITGEVRAKEIAIESENSLLLAADATGFAIWDVDIPQDTFSHSAQMTEIFGQPPGTQFTLTGIRSQVHPDDMENIVKKSYDQALKTGTHAYEARIYWPDKSLRWIRAKGRVLFNAKNEPYRMIGTILDITESKRDEIRKNDFIAMASHELKTPLTSLKAYIQLLASKLDKTPDPFINTALLKAANQVNKMTALIHSFLDISKLEPGKLQLKRQTFDINKLIEETIAERLIIANSHLLRFHPTEIINVYADREKIGQVLSNFISNGIKYSQKGSSITLYTEVADGNIRVSVSDEGMGIKQKEQEKIFQRFYRADNDDLKNISGFGIGLYLSSEIIQRHKGKIWVKSIEGKGSTFYFSLPMV